jgi:hypothetical protein
MPRRRDEFGRGRSRWGQRDIFSERRRRRFPWIPVLVVAAVAAAVYAFSDPRVGGQIGGLWAGISNPASTPAPAAEPAPAPQGRDDRFTTLPLPPEPPGAR